MFKVDFEIALFFEFVWYCYSLKGWANILVERIAKLRHKHFFSFIRKGQQAAQKPHINAMIDVDIWDVHVKLRMIKIFDSSPELWNSSWATVAMMIFIQNAFLEEFIALIFEKVPLYGIWNSFWP